MLQSFVASQMDISHQEMDRIITELEAVYGSQPTTWLPVEAIGMMLTHELGCVLTCSWGLPTTAEVFFRGRAASSFQAPACRCYIIVFLGFGVVVGVNAFPLVW